jgi:DNA topoisomerase IA
MNLMIVESPNKVKKIKTLLGPGWDVAASVGHVRDLPQKSLGVTTPDYQLQSPSPGGLRMSMACEGSSSTRTKRHKAPP